MSDSIFDSELVESKLQCVTLQLSGFVFKGIALGFPSRER